MTTESTDRTPSPGVAHHDGGVRRTITYHPYCRSCRWEGTTTENEGAALTEWWSHTGEHSDEQNGV